MRNAMLSVTTCQMAQGLGLSPPAVHLGGEPLVVGKGPLRRPPDPAAEAAWENVRLAWLRDDEMGFAPCLPTARLANRLALRTLCLAGRTPGAAGWITGYAQPISPLSGDGRRGGRAFTRWGERGIVRIKIGNRNR